MKTVGRAFGLTAAVAAMLSVSAVAAAGPAKTEGGLLKGAVHADIGTLTANGTTREVTLDRGAVTASTPTSISLERADGQSVTLAVALATKVRGRMGKGPNQVGLSRLHIVEAVEASLRRLKTDYIDLYQCHIGTLKDPSIFLEAFEHLKKQGKIRAYGISTDRREKQQRQRR